MPMIPSPLAAIAYCAVKVVGYAAFARGLNKTMGANVEPNRFGVAKTFLGLVGGLAYLFAIVPAVGIRENSELSLFIGAIPVRLVVWCIVLALFYGFRARSALMLSAAVAGTAWSYVLDGLMWGIYRVIPGMVMPFC